jgi:ABC-type bacteriocin/lantibiotic exporter with double-glycine peptidase domain
MLFLGVASTIAARGDDALSHPWRSAANGGVNVLFCYLRAHGVACEYPELLREQAEEEGPTHTAATLSRLAAKSGLPLQPALLTMDELSSCPLPVIVHMDGESPEAGAFLLILAMTTKSIDYMNGPTATVHSMECNDFRRIWSGIALLPLTSRRRDVALCAAGFCAGVILTLAFRFALLRSVS